MEAKLAETAPKRPVALTVVAAIGTLVVIAGVFTGPTVLNCLNASEFGACLRDGMSEAGLLPPEPVPTEVAAVAGPNTQGMPAGPAGSETSLVPDLPPGDSPVAPSGEKLPQFGLLRAEPDGSVVVAGSGEPGQELEFFANGASIGTAIVERSGDWVFVPEAPLQAGGLELTLGVKGSDVRAAQSFVVVIDPDRSSEPLVVASVPGQASDILQGIARTTPQIAAVDENAVTALQPGGAPDLPADTVDQSAADGEQPTPTPAMPAEDAAAAGPGSGAEAARPPDEPEVQIAEAEPTAPEPQESEPEAPADSEVQPDAGRPAPTQTLPAEDGAAARSGSGPDAAPPQDEPEIQIAAAEPTDPEPQEREPEAPADPEIQSDAGAPTPPESDAAEIAIPEPNTGEEPAASQADQAAEPMALAGTAGNDTPADQVQDQPEGPVTALAQGEGEGVSGDEAPVDLAAVDPDDVATPAPDLPAEPTVAAVQPTIDAIEIDNARNFFAGGGPEGATVRLYVDDAYVADAIVSGGRWLVETANVLTKPTQRVRVDLLAAGTAEVLARAEVNFVVDVPVEVQPQAPIVVAENAGAEDSPAVGAGVEEPAAEDTQSGEEVAAQLEANEPLASPAEPEEPTEPQPRPGEPEQQTTANVEGEAADVEAGEVRQGAVAPGAPAGVRLPPQPATGIRPLEPRLEPETDLGEPPQRPAGAAGDSDQQMAEVPGNAITADVGEQRPTEIGEGETVLPRRDPRTTPRVGSAEPVFTQPRTKIKVPDARVIAGVPAQGPLVPGGQDVPEAGGETALVEVEKDQTGAIVPDQDEVPGDLAAVDAAVDSVEAQDEPIIPQDGQQEAAGSEPEGRAIEAAPVAPEQRQQSQSESEANAIESEPEAPLAIAETDVPTGFTPVVPHSDPTPGSLAAVGTTAVPGEGETGPGAPDDRQFVQGELETPLVDSEPDQSLAMTPGDGPIGATASAPEEEQVPGDIAAVDASGNTVPGEGGLQTAAEPQQGQEQPEAPLANDEPEPPLAVAGGDLRAGVTNSAPGEGQVPGDIAAVDASGNTVPREGGLETPAESQEGQAQLEAPVANDEPEPPLAVVEGDLPTGVTTPVPVEGQAPDEIATIDALADPSARELSLPPRNGGTVRPEGPVSEEAVTQPEQEPLAAEREEVAESAEEPARPALQPEPTTAGEAAAEPDGPAFELDAPLDEAQQPPSEPETRLAEPEVAPYGSDQAVADAQDPEQPNGGEDEIPTLFAVPVGDPADQRFASGKAIIRRGDNLWTIARRVYGEGIKYTTIYQANTGQIRDPARIYPGQVFELPNQPESGSN